MIKFGPIILVMLSFLGFSPDDHQLFYDESLYEKSSYEAAVELEGMVVPHHILPIDMLTDMYQRGGSDVAHVVLISPDHFLNQKRHVTTSLKDWSGRFGKVFNNQKLTTTLLELPFVTENDYEILTEHGLYTHIPFIAEYFPKADVVTLAISKETTMAELDEIIRYIPDDAFIIASVDFSHYLTRDEAEENDKVTMSLLSSGQYERLFMLNDGYFDSPGSLYVIFKVLDQFEMVVYDHKNAYDYLGTFHNTTSYFTIGFLKETPK